MKYEDSRLRILITQRSQRVLAATISSLRRGLLTREDTRLRIFEIAMGVKAQLGVSADSILLARSAMWFSAPARPSSSGIDPVGRGICLMILAGFPATT